MLNAKPRMRAWLSRPAELERREVLRRKEASSRRGGRSVRHGEGATQAAVDAANAMIRDAQFDLDHCRITAPFTGRMGTHLVSVGNLIAGNRGGVATTLLATIVSVDPIYLDFDMSETDYMTFARDRANQRGPLADKLQVSLSDEKSFRRNGTLDFIDNSLDRSSGTIHARATLANTDLLLTPGGFARVRLRCRTLHAPARPGRSRFSRSVGIRRPDRRPR